jgi:hypothetical protein
LAKKLETNFKIKLLNWLKNLHQKLSVNGFFRKQNKIIEKGQNYAEKQQQTHN